MTSVNPRSRPTKSDTSSQDAVHGTLTTESQQQLRETQAQHEAVTTQFTEQLQQKDRQLAALEHQIKLLLQRIKGSRQERINPVGSKKSAEH